MSRLAGYPLVAHQRQGPGRSWTFGSSGHFLAMAAMCSFCFGGDHSRRELWKWDEMELKSSWGGYF